MISREAPSVRLPKNIKEILQKAAKNNDRSLNGEVLHRLKDDMKRKGELID